MSMYIQEVNNYKMFITIKIYIMLYFTHSDVYSSSKKMNLCAAFKMSK